MFKKLMTIPVLLTIGVLSGGTPYAMAADIPNEDFAVVESNGGLNRGTSGIKSSLRISEGTYDVSFNKAVDECFYQGTIGLTEKSKTPPPGQISVAPSSVAAPKRVRVRTFDSSGTLADQAFYLYVGCN